VTASLTYPDPPLTDGVVLLRQWTGADLGCVEEASRDAYICNWFGIPSPYTENDGIAWIERQSECAEEGRGLALAISDVGSGDALGGTSLIPRPHPGTVGIAYWVIERARGHRYASRAVALLARWSITDAGFQRLEALVEPENIASQRVLKVLPFEAEGRLRSYLSSEGRGLMS
jgi:[ribosomal protein S5]-alanine N-acetyltransferase